jgi:hypothetical protein
MTINFNQLDKSQKNVQFLNGIFNLETDGKSSWIWTSKKIIGLVSNVDFITIKAFSDIDNVLLYENNKMEIKPDCLNIIKLNVAGKRDFTFELEDVYKPVGDSRELGIRIINIFVDGELSF